MDQGDNLNQADVWVESQPTNKNQYHDGLHSCCLPPSVEESNLETCFDSFCQFLFQEKLRKKGVTGIEGMSKFTTCPKRKEKKSKERVAGKTILTLHVQGP